MDDEGEAIVAADSPILGDAGIIEADAEIAADAATLNSDAAVGGSVGGGSGERRRVDGGSGGSSSQSCVVAGPDAGGGADHRPIRPHHHRKRALSAANSSSSGSMAAAVATGRASSGRSDRDGHPSSGGGSLMNSSICGGAEHSIVSFGLNFNFDSTSSPSNSDDGKGCGGEGSNSDDDNNNNGGRDDNRNANGDSLGGASGAVKTSGENERKKKKKKKKSSHHKHHRRGGSGGDESSRAHGTENENRAPARDDGENNEDGNTTTKKERTTASVRFPPEAAEAACARRTSDVEGSSTSSGSDSSMNDVNGGNTSGGSNSGNDGSSGGKSTVSSLTTSSNQEWMAAQNEGGGAGMPTSAEGQAAAATVVTSEAKSSRSTAQVSWDKGVEGGKDVTSKTKDATSVKKRKKTTGGTTIENAKTDGGNEEDDGYKTDEEWGGSGWPSHHDSGTNNVLPGRGPLATHKGSSSLLKANNIMSSENKSQSGSSEGPPMKQARFQMDHQNLSSLSGSDSAVVPIGTASSGGGKTLGLPDSSAVALTMSSNPSSTPRSSSANAESALNSRPAHRGGTAVEPTKRKERNAREKERSCRIARQIDDLRALLSRGGVTVSKTTKSSVLAEAASYISVLQQQQSQWEMERQTLMQQMQQLGVIANPAVGQLNLLQKEIPINPLDAGVYPMAAQQPAAFPQQMSPGVQRGFIGQCSTLPMNPPPPEQAPPQSAVNAVNQNDYKFVFNNSSVGMAIASLGGAFIDCNSVFCHLSEYTKEEVCAMTIFNMTSRQDLQHAFDLISQMITPTLDGSDKGEEKPSIVLRGAMKNRSDLGLSISLIKGDHGIAKCFSVTLVRILSVESTKQDTVSIEMELPQVSVKQQNNVGFGAGPAYTAG